MASRTMTLARALTKRARRNHDTTPARGTSVKYSAGSIDRNLISLPTELISTTNVHALTAPDIGTRNVSSGSSSSSINDSEFSSVDKTIPRTPTLSADTSSIESPPTTPITPRDVDSRDFFYSNAKRPVSMEGISALSAPAIPQRALSHSKKAHVELSRKRSLQRLSPPPTFLSDRSVTRSSAVAIAPDHPFHKELTQVNEVAEEFGLASSVSHEEHVMQIKGLKKFSVEDYLDEIAGLYGGIFEDKLGFMARPCF